MSYEIDTRIRTEGIPACYLCGSPGSVLYSHLGDTVFKTPGSWNLRKCLSESCSLIWMDPIPAPEHLSDIYSNYYTHRVLAVESTSFQRRVYRFLKRCYLSLKYGYRPTLATHYLRFLGLIFYATLIKRSSLDYSVMTLHRSSGQRLLDIGCGDGSFLLTMQKLGWEVEGIDTDPNVVTNLRTNLGLKVALGTLGEAHLNKGSFDVVTLSHVIEHVRDPIKLLRESRSYLRPGGTLILMTPNASSWGHQIYGKNWRGLEPPRHFILFTKKTLEQCTLQAGFQTLELRTTSRWTRNIIVASDTIRQVERGHEYHETPTFCQRVIGYSFQLIETIGEMLGIDCGEELYYAGTNIDAN